MDISPDEWLEIIRREYLEDFVREGGAAVKFVVSPSETSRRELRDGLRKAAEDNGFHFAFVDAASTKVHLVDKLFHEVARQVEWDALTHSFLARLLKREGVELPPEPDGFRLSVIAELSHRVERLFRNEVRGWIEDALFRDYEMSQEFRLGMIRLCLAQLDPDDDPALRDAVKEWLRGELRLISAVKRALIFQKIARHNARHMLFSLAHWLKVAGKSGLVLALDISRYAEATKPSEPGGALHYSTAAAIDLYEVLRQFIDATDEVEFCFIGVLAGPQFLTDEHRGIMSRYPALHLRVSDEVRDKNLPNPRSSLVRSAARDQAAAFR